MSRTVKHNTNNQQIRIIGGDWRGRKLSFPDFPGLRPSSDRVRETLFNWLAPYIPGSRCLDLFAGSGALGLEAASRGAKQVLLVDDAPQVAAALEQNIALLNAEGRVSVACKKAEHFVRSGLHEPFDIIFLDPPFAHNALLQLSHELVEHHLTQHNTRIYIESEVHSDTPALPESWSTLKMKTTRQVRYQLAIQESLLANEIDP